VYKTHGDPLATPVVLLFFNRPDTTRRVMAQIKRAKPQTLYLVQDGARPDVPGEQALVEVTRNIAEDVDWECDVVRVYSDTNLGLRERVVTGLDRVFAEVERAIILEDDCVANDSFFRFCEETLERYADNTRVGTVSGNNFLRGRFVTEDSYFFSPDVRIWGWGTWRRVWQDFSREGLRHEWSQAEASDVLAGFPSPSRKKALVSMAASAQKIDSWALPFVLHCQRRNYLSVVPEVNLVKNIGFGATSTHTRFESFTDELPTKRLEFPLRHPQSVVRNDEAGKLEHALYRKMWVTFPLRHPISFLGRVFRYLASR
jgi:hypothetical protein